MADSNDELERLRSVALQNSPAILAARQEAERELIAAKEALAQKVEELARAAEERKGLLDSEHAARTEAERLSALKDEFLATLTHELRTPLSAILGWAQVLKRGARDEADLRKGLDAIERNARAQAQLIEDLLDTSRITSGKVRLDVQPVQPISFVEAAIETVRPAADAKGIRLEKLLDPAAGPISGDPGRLQQIVWNLLSNAIKFTPREGKVQVMLERVNSHIEISVADTGIGVSPEFLSHVFERFRQADASTTRTHSGLGLGLSIVKTLVEMHGGTVSISPGLKSWSSTLSLTHANWSNACFRNAMRKCLPRGPRWRHCNSSKAKSPTCSSATSACRTSMGSCFSGECVRSGRPGAAQYLPSHSRLLRAAKTARAHSTRALSRTLRNLSMPPSSSQRSRPSRGAPANQLPLMGIQKGPMNPGEIA